MKLAYAKSRNGLSTGKSACIQPYRGPIHTRITPMKRRSHHRVRGVTPTSRYQSRQVDSGFTRILRPVEVEPECLRRRLSDPAGIKQGAYAADIIAQMRTLVCLLICTIACMAQRPEDDVLAVYRQMEKAEQTGDANIWVGLWSREGVANAEKMRPYLRPRPNAHYTSSKVFVQGDDAALLGQIGEGQFLGMRLVKEDGHWKIKDQVWSDKAFHADSVYAMIPPAAGAFEHAGAPWQKVAPAFDGADAAKRGWQVRAIYDGSYLYVRIESSTPFPAPGSTVEKPPSEWPVMKVGVSGVAEFVLHVSADIGDQ